MDVITEKPRPVVPHCGACCGASGPGQGAHAQYRPARSEAVTWPTGPGSSTRRRWQGPARLRDDVPNRRASHATARDQTGPGCGGRGCRRGLAGLQDRSHRAVRLACGDHAGRPPPTDATHGRIKQPGPTDTRHQARATSYTRNTSGPLPPPTDTAHRCSPRAHQAARPHSRIRRRPEHHPDPQPQPQTQQKAGRNLSVPARPRYSATIGATRQVVPRGRWRYATGGATRQVIASAPLQLAVSSARPPCRPCRSSRR